MPGDEPEQQRQGGQQNEQQNQALAACAAPEIQSGPRPRGKESRRQSLRTEVAPPNRAPAIQIILALEYTK